MNNWVEKLIKQYGAETYQLEKYRRSLNKHDPLAAEEAETISGMISDLRYSLEWIKRGRRPGNRRGAEKTDVYRQREILKELANTEWNDEKLVAILLDMSERERTCFLLHMAHGLTYSEISAKLKVSIRTVRSYIDRAKSKVQQRICS